MRKKNYEVLFANNIKMTESLKAELIDAIGCLFKALVRADHAETSTALANIIMITYILGDKLGIDCNTIDLLAKNQLQNSMEESDEKDQWYEDMKRLMQYLEARMG